MGKKDKKREKCGWEFNETKKKSARGKSEANMCEFLKRKFNSERKREQKIRKGRELVKKVA